MDSTARLGQEKIGSLLVTFSIPAIVGMIVMSLYNVIDRIFIGNSAGFLGIAAITVGFPIMIVQFAFIGMIGMGATALVSIRLGQQRREEAESIMGNALVLLAGLALTMTALGLVFTDPLLRIFGASDEVMPLARTYIRIILGASIFQSLSFGMNNFIRAEGHPRTAMATMIIGAVLNAILAPIFIFGFGWGMAGAGLATALAQAVSAIWVMLHFLLGRSTLKIRRKQLRVDLAVTRRMMALGSAFFAMQFSQSILSAIMNTSLGIYGGDIAISGMGIVISLMTLIMMPIVGINQGAQPIIGYNYGAQRYDRVKAALKYAAMAATAIATAGFVVIRLFPTQLITIFNSQDAELIAFGSNALVVFLTFLPLIGFQIVGSGYFQAVGQPKKSLILSLSRQVLILIPALLILPRFFHLSGVLMAGPVADLAASLLTGAWLLAEVRQLNRRHADRRDGSSLVRSRASADS
ncbi:MAG: MATE family efflux transporter [Sphingomonadaceae bacterium]